MASASSGPFHGTVYKCLKECLDTEKTYIQDLEILMQYYHVLSTKQKSYSLPEGLTASKVKTIFQDIPKLLTLHQEWFPDFERYISTGDASVISHIVKKKMRVMRLYGDYIITIPSAQDITIAYEGYFNVSCMSHECCTVVLIAFFLQIKELKEQEGIDKVLNRVLVTPFQRITRYSLLIKALIEEESKASDNQVNIPALESLLKDVNDVVDYVNKVQEARAVKELPVRF